MSKCKIVVSFRIAPILTVAGLSPAPRSKTLESDGIIKRKVYTSKPPLKVEYSLTDLGKTLIPLIQSIADCGDFVVQQTKR